MSTKKTATNKVLWLFAIGQLGWSLLSGIIANWLVFFYQPSQEELDKGQLLFIPKGTFIGLTAIGIITAFGRIFDAVTDPFIAGKSDSLKHKLGRRIPFMRFAAVPFGIVTVLIFVSPFGEKSMGNAIFLFVFAMMFYFCMTCYCTPYNALIPELGSTQNTRINLSTFISVTYFFGTAIAYLVPNIAGFFLESLGYAASFRVTIAILAAVAVICMLVPAFLIDENEYADTTPSKSTAFKSLLATFRNKGFRIFVCSDILYWIGLTLFQTGLSFYITVLLGLDSGMTFPLFAIMTVVSLAFYPLV
ncbi:MFS transporter, partial [Ruminococcus sp.]